MSAQKSNNAVPKLYHGVINEVIDSVRDSFLDEGIDEAVLADLKAMWRRRLEETKALEERKNASQDQVGDFLKIYSIQNLIKIDFKINQNLRSCTSTCQRTTSQATRIAPNSRINARIAPHRARYPCESFKQPNHFFR